MFKHFQFNHGLLFVLALIVVALAFFWQPAMELVGELETHNLNARAEKEGWVGRYPVHYTPVEVKRVGN